MNARTAGGEPRGVVKTKCKIPSKPPRPKDKHQLSSLERLPAGMIRQQVDADTGDCGLPDNAEIGDYSPVQSRPAPVSPIS
jgi:hypothetical protein